MEERALKLLKKYYRGNKYTNPFYGQFSADEFEYCKEDGVVFEEVNMSHREMLSELKSTIDLIKIDDVVNGFLYSLSSGETEYRTALASYIYAKSIPDHIYTPDRNRCKFCSFPAENDGGDDTSVLTDLNPYSYVRFFGGIQDLGNITYVLHDLKAFIQLPKVKFRQEDVLILSRILKCTTKIGNSNKVIALQKMITKEKVLQASKTEVDMILGILSMCGILQTKEHFGYIYRFTKNSDRGFEYECDLYYPLNHWRGKNGINYSAFEKIFGPVIKAQITKEKIEALEDMSSIDDRQSLTTRKSKAENYFEDNKYSIEFVHGERPYFALDEIEPSWEKIEMFSTTYKIHKRTVFFFEDDVIRKIIYEEKEEDKDGALRCRSYTEFNTEIRTKNRKTILPKTNIGREKSLTPTHAMNSGGIECHFHVIFKKAQEASYMYCANAKNVQYLHFLGDEEIKDNHDFRKYAEEYVKNCPKDHLKRINRMRYSKHVTIKFTAGDIFRVEFDCRYYGYGIILGKIRQLEKWNEIPKEHVFRKQMTQPILFRMYDIVTENGNLKKEDLQGIGLLPLDIAQDNEIIWGTYPIIDNKILDEEDVDLPFLIESVKKNGTEKVRVTWGTAIIELKPEDIPELLEYKTNSFNTSLSMNFNYLLSKHGYLLRDLGNNEIKVENAALLKKKLIKYFGEEETFTIDDFARKYKGLTRKQFIKLTYERSKR